METRRQVQSALSGRRASLFRSAPRGSRSEAPISPSRTEGAELERMQGVIDDHPRERSQWMGGRHEVKSVGSLYSHGFGDDCGHSVRHEWKLRSTKQEAKREGVPPDAAMRDRERQDINDTESGSHQRP